MKLKPGQVLEEFELEGHRVVFRTPKRGDAPACMRHVNRMVAQRLQISMQTRITLAAEKVWLRGVIKRNLSGQGVHLLVLVDGEIIGGGSVGVGPMAGSRHVATLGVALHKHRGQGIGTRLIRLLEQAARARLGAEILRLAVFGGNAGARRLYRRLGFRQCGKVPRGGKHYGKYVDELILVKPLRR
jgi:RimJ/RimL family protein N-acetyltransferase